MFEWLLLRVTRGTGGGAPIPRKRTQGANIENETRRRCAKWKLIFIPNLHQGGNTVGEIIKRNRLISFNDSNCFGVD